MSTSKDSKKTWGSGGLLDQYREIFSLLLMITTPFFCMLVWYSCKNYRGDFFELYNKEFVVNVTKVHEEIGKMQPIFGFDNSTRKNLAEAYFTQTPRPNCIKEYPNLVFGEFNEKKDKIASGDCAADLIFEYVKGVSKYELETAAKFFSHFWNNVSGKVMQAPWTDKAINMWKLIFSYMIFEIILMKFVPGPTFTATLTKTGHRPVYIDNGVPCYFISVAACFLLWKMDYKFFEEYEGKGGCSIPEFLYENFGLFLSCLNIFALLFCVMLTYKGLNQPSTKDSGTNGNWIVDYFWGTELYPRIYDIDVKQFTNCRFGLMYWQVGILCYAFAQYDRYEGYISSSMFVSVFLQSVYIFKFFWWETGYFNSMDIQHDRAGYYICWGCLVWVPSVYTMHTYYLVNNPNPIPGGLPMTILLTVIGLLCIYCNYDCDRQRAEVRATNGNCKVFGRNPVVIHAKYQVEGSTEEKTNLLLVNGWWGLARHVHYTFEIMAAFCWCLPAMLVSGWSSYSYVGTWFYWVFLTILLYDRSFRDDKRCSAKYGEYWEEYRERVPFKIVPGVV